MIEIYSGNGKGKSTAAAGLALRAAGYGIPVVYVQFLKDGSSGEMQILKNLPGVHRVLPQVFHGFVFRMTEEEKEETAADCGRMLREAFAKVEALLRKEESRAKVQEPLRKGDSPAKVCAPPKEKETASADIRVLWILDEVLDALRLEVLTESELSGMLDMLPEDAEIVLTGRAPSDVILQRADYITEFRNLRHPYAQGVTARIGVEL